MTLNYINRLGIRRFAGLVFLLITLFFYNGCVKDTSNEIDKNLEDAISEQMVVEAALAAHLIAVAENAGLTKDEINSHLKLISDNSVISEFWITDEKGNAYLTNTGIDFSFSPDPKIQPQAAEFWKLISGKQNVVIQEAQKREIDNNTFKYVGVAGIDKPRIVQIGLNMEKLKQNADIETAVGNHMQTQALLASYLVAIAEKAGLSSKEINSHLKAIAACTILDEFWITDSLGNAYLKNVDIDFTFSADPKVQPQAYEFWDLISGTKKSVIQKAQKREIDDQVFKYAGATGIDKPRIVQVGIQYNYFK